MKKVKYIVEKTSTGFSAFAEESPIYTTGKTITELKENIREASELYNEEYKEAEIEFEFDLQQFFQYYKVLNARHLADRIGMNHTLLSQYVKGIKKPSVKQTKRILSGIQQIGKELVELKLIYKV